VLVRYVREFRDSPESLKRVLIRTPSGANVPLSDLLISGEPAFRRGPMMIKSEEGALVSYVLFDSHEGLSEVEVVEEAQRFLGEAVSSGRLALPAGVSYRFAGNYENQVRSEKRLMIILPLSLLVILLILYMQFNRLSVSLFIFSGIAVAWAGGFITLWLYGQPWFLDFTVAGQSLRDLFQISEVNLSVAVWVGFIALFGVATDDGVVMATYIKQSLEKREPKTRQEVREAIIAAAVRRARPCLMTTATTILALLPVMTSTGKGADIMVPMAIPSFGGLTIEVISMFVLPVLYAMWEEMRLLWR
jgi:Cu(I)/Ag(I) efflux system membrane protein CusA/SilA